MGKVNLNKKNKSEKDADFKRRKSNLGQGKHKHLSHTKIDLQSVALRVPTQQKFENVEVQQQQPNIQQLKDLILLCHSENDKKILSGLSGLLSFLPKSGDLFLPKISEVLASVLHLLRHAEGEIRESAQNVITWILSRYPNQCSPFIPVFVRHISAQASSPSMIIKKQSSFLLEKIVLLPNLQPIPSLFELFPLMIRYSNDVDTFIIFTKVITKVLKRFAQTKDYNIYNSYDSFTFPRLFPENNSTYAIRFRPQCLLDSSAIENLVLLLDNYKEHFELISGDDMAEPVSCLCGLLIVINQLNSNIDLEPFLNFADNHFPYVSGSIKQNVIIAKFLLELQSAHDKIKEFLSSIKPSVENLVLFSSLSGCDFNIPSFSEAIPEICNSKISEEAAPGIADALVNSILTEPKTTKRTLRVLISLKKSNSFQDKLITVLKSKLLESTPSITNLLIILVSSCAPLSRGFLKQFAEFIQDIPEQIFHESVEAVTLTNDKTDESAIISFLMTLGTKRPTERDYLKRQIKRLEILSDEESRHLYSRLNLTDWTIINI